MSNRVEEWLNQQEQNSAAPTGLRQVAGGAASYGEDNPATAGNSLFDRYRSSADTAVSPGMDVAKSWYGGANMESTTNGWDTGWMAVADKQYEEQLKATDENGNTEFYNWFDRKDATGVAFWDDASKGVKVGNVYNDGELVGNVREDFDEQTANAMMARWALDAKTQSKIYADPDRDAWLATELNDTFAKNTQNAATTLQQADFQNAVAGRQRELLDGFGDEALALTSAAAGGGFALGLLAKMGAGAAAGSVVPGAGTVAGAAVVGLTSLAFGAAAYLNRDQLTFMTARAQETTSRANEEFGWVQGLSQGAQEFGGVGIRLISPVGNLNQGLVDGVYGERGDGTAEYFELTEDGDRKVHGVFRALDLAAALGDGVLQFSNPVGWALYSGGTASYVAGRTGMMATAGAGWNDSTASFDDYEGGKEWGAAIAMTGIEAAQLGFAGALGSVSRTLQRQAGPMAGRVEAGRGLLPSWSKKHGAASTEVQGGMKFALDASGKAIAVRPTVQLLAPSEFLRWLPATARARNRALLSGTAGTGTRSTTWSGSKVAGPDDFYQAALSLNTGSRFSSAVLNGWLEGAEEGIQAILEPMSFGDSASISEIMEATLYGAAGGAGMSLGAMLQQPSSARQVEARHRLKYERVEGPTTDAEWAAYYKDLTKEQKVAGGRFSEDELEAIQKTYAGVQELQRIDRSRTSVIGTLAIEDARKSRWARDLARANPALDESLELTGRAEAHTLGGEIIPTNAGGMSAWRAMRSIALHIQSFDVLQTDATRRLDALKAIDVETLSPEQLQNHERDMAQWESEVALMPQLLEVSAALGSHLEQLYETYTTKTDRAEAEAAIDEINEFIGSAHEGRMTDPATGELFDPNLQELARRTMEVPHSRSPHIDGGYLFLVRPFISKAMTEDAQHGSLGVFQGRLKAPGGDHDGDTMMTQVFSLIPPATRERLRTGSNYFEASTREVTTGELDANGDPVVTETRWWKVVMDGLDDEKALLQMVREGTMRPVDDPRHLAATAAVDNLMIDVYERYTGVLDEQQLLAAINTFAKDFAQGSADARIELIEAIANIDLDAFLARAAGTSDAEPMWLSQRITQEISRFQRDFAAVDPSNMILPEQVHDPLPEDQAFERSRVQRQMATDGQTMSSIFAGTGGTRDAQKPWYSLMRQAVKALDGDMLPADVEQYTRLFVEIAGEPGKSDQSEVDRITAGRSPVQRRANEWLQEIVDAAYEEQDGTGPSYANLKILLGGTMVRDVEMTGENQWQVTDGQISLAQLLLKRSVMVERTIRYKALEADPDGELATSLNRLDRLTRREASGHSISARLALYELLAQEPAQNLLGEDSKYVGRNVTMGQLAKSLENKTPSSRNNIIHNWLRAAPAAISEYRGDPPFTAEVVASGSVSAYRVFVETIKSVTDNAASRKVSRNATEVAQLETAFADHARALEQQRTFLGRTGEKKMSPEKVLETMLADRSYAQKIADLIPEATRMGAFELVDGRVYAAPWVEQMLLSPPAKAAKDYILHTKLAEWNALGGNINHDGTTEKEVDADTGEPAPPRHPREYAKIKSRFLQTMASLAHERGVLGHLELDAFIKKMFEAESIEQMQDAINSNPRWRGNRAEWLALFDDTAEYEADPSTIWSANLPGTIQREAIQKFSEKANMMHTVLKDANDAFTSDQPLIADMKTFHKSGTDQSGGKGNWRKLELLIANRKATPDLIGPRSRDAFLQLIQNGVIRMQDKGKADLRAAPMGEHLVSVDSFGIKQSIFATVDATTAYDVQDVLSNMSKLVEGPVRVGLVDGSYVTVDLSTPAAALKALENPSLYPLAMAVLSEGVRDINPAGVLQTYALTPVNSTRQEPGSGSLQAVLDSADNSNLQWDYDSSPSTRQAHTLVSTLESRLRAKAIELGPDAQQKAYFAVQKILNEFAIAMTHQQGFKNQDHSVMRDRLLVNVSEAIMEIAAVHRKDPSGESLRKMKEKLYDLMYDRYRSSRNTIAKALRDPAERAAVESMQVDAFVTLYAQEQNRLMEIIANTNLPQAVRDNAADAQTRLQKRAEERADRITELIDEPIVQATIQMFQVKGDSTDTDTKTSIMEFLGKQGRMNRFTLDYGLIHNVKAILAESNLNVHDDRITSEDWDTLSGMAASVYLAELGGRAGTSQSLTPIILGPKGADLQRFWDPTFASLLDRLFDEDLLTAAAELGAGYSWNPPRSWKKAGDRIASRLLNEKNFGEWTELIVSENVKAGEVLANAAVGLAIPTGGQQTKDIAAYAGNQARDYTPPPADSTTALQIPILLGELQLPSDSFIRLDRHFMQSLVLRGMDVNGAVEIDLLQEIGHDWTGEESVSQSGIRWIALEELEMKVNELLNSTDFVGDQVLDIEYFDVDNRPEGPKWVNNIYFDGVGREDGSGFTPTLIGSLVAGVGGVRKFTMQNPMDAATREGKGFAATKTTPLETALKAEGLGTLSETLMEKTAHMVMKAVDSGPWLAGDPSILYKFQKQRHIVVGRDAEGKLQRRWAQDVIQWEAANNSSYKSDEFYLRDVKLVPLSDAQARTLLGEPGDKGLPGVIERPVLGQIDTTTYPDLSDARIERLGLERLGQETPLSHAKDLHVLPIAKHSGSDFRQLGDAVGVSPRMSLWTSDYVDVHHSRMQQSSSGSNKLDIPRISERNARALHNMLGTEALAEVMARMGVPWTEARNLSEVSLTQFLTSQLEKLVEVNPTTMIFSFNLEGVANPAEGILTPASVKANFGKTQWGWPTYKDTVVFELGQFEARTGGDLEKAFELARDTLKSFTDRGVTIVLGHAGGGTTLRSDLMHHLNQGQEGYQRSMESAHIFVPQDGSYTANDTRLALRSSLTATHVFAGKSILLEHYAPEYSAWGSNENFLFRDFREEQPVWEAVTHTLIPTELQVSDGPAYNLPLRGVGPSDTFTGVRDRILPLLDSAEGRKFLAKQLGGDPKGVSLQKRLPNGDITPGVLSVQDALKKLGNELRADKIPGDVGQEIQLGSLYLLEGTNDSLFIGRIGFKFPSSPRWLKQLDATLKVGDGTPTPMKIAAATSELSPNWTISPPSTVTEVFPDPIMGTSVISEYGLHNMSKELMVGDGFKSMGGSLPPEMKPPRIPLAANGLRINTFGGEKGLQGKQSLTNIMEDFKSAALLTGISFKPELLNFFKGEKKRTPEEIQREWPDVQIALETIQELDHGYTAEQIAGFVSSGDFVALAQLQLNQAFSNIADVSLDPTLKDPWATLSPSERISYAVLSSIMAPGVRWQEVVETNGMMTLDNLQGGVQVRKFMDLLAAPLTDFTDLALQDHLNKKLNDRMPREADGSMPYRITKDYLLEVRWWNSEAKEYFYTRGPSKLSLTSPMSANDVNYVASAMRRDRQGASEYNALIAAQSLGITTIVEDAGREIENLFSDEGITRFSDDLGDGGFRDLLRAVPSVDKTYTPWKQRSAGANVDAQLSHAKRVSYLEKIDTKADGWDDSSERRFNDKVRAVRQELGLDDPGWDAEIHYSIRQLFGAPAARLGQPEYVGILGPDAAIQGAELVLQNVQKGKMPAYGGNAPLIDDTFLRAIFKHNSTKARGWAPAINATGTKRAEANYTDWVNTIFGQLKDSPYEIRAAFRGDIDGFMHSYQNATEEFLDLPFSLDDVTNAKLIHPEISQYVTSLDPNMEAILNNPPLFDNVRVTTEALLSGDPETSWMGAHTNPSSALADRVNQVAAWHAKKELPREVQTSARSYLEEGTRYLSSKKETHTFFTGLVNASIIMRVANPQLWASAILENSFKVALDNGTDIFTGTGTGWSSQQIAKVAERFGMETQFTVEQQKRINQLADRVGGNTEWQATIMDEIAYSQFVEVGAGGISKKLEKGAAWAAKMFSEPASGMTAKTRAKRYLISALQYLDATDSSYSFDALAARIDHDPMYLSKQFSTEGMSPHRAGLNAVAHSRNMKANVPSKIVMGAIESWAGHPKTGWNVAGTLLKIPLLFTRFNTNMTMTMTGTTGWDQVVATWLDGRESPMLARLNSYMKGEQYVEGQATTIDMSDVLLGVDLTRPFMQGALTHGAVMAFGLMAGSLGLTGEDEEMKRRRKLAALRDLPLYYDPRRMENDFIFADAMFLDNLPGPLQALAQPFAMAVDSVSGETRKVIKPHWIINQFLAPIIGMERFFNTGDTRQIKWGFQEAFSLIPNSVQRVWDEASVTSDLLLQQAVEGTELGTDENNSQVVQALMTTAMIYQKALLESSFVNGIRSGSDVVDRDPWALPEVDEETGEIVPDLLLPDGAEGPARSTDLISYVDEETGEVKQHYAKRDVGGLLGARSHGIAENNLTYALMASLFTGQWGTESSFLRKNMVAKTPKVSMAPIEKAEAEALILAAWQGLAANDAPLPELMTVDEIARTLKADAQAQGEWWDEEEILKEAQAMHAANGEGYGALSLVKDNQEQLTKEGARAVIHSLSKGSVQLGDSSLANIYITREMRQELQDEIYEDLVVEGLNMGMQESAARYRAGRIWRGNTDEDPTAIGLRDIVWSTSIPRKATAEYTQLNVAYVMGPDGMPWATPFGRNDWIRSLGIPLPAKNVISEQAGLGVDNLGKVIDNTLNINTGLHALERREDNEPFEIPELDYNMKLDIPASESRGYSKSGGYRRRGGGGGGGGYSSSGYTGGSSYFSRMNSLPRGSVPYSNSIPAINVSNPNIRRANIRRERVWSERGRLKQWQ